jgi:hypothetical protein
VSLTERMAGRQASRQRDGRRSHGTLERRLMGGDQKELRNGERGTGRDKNMTKKREAREKHERWYECHRVGRDPQREMLGWLPAGLQPPFV